MTLLLIAGIGLTMYVYGQSPDLPQGSDTGGPEQVTQAQSNEPGLLTRVGALIESTETSPADIERVPLGDEKRAIEIALAATVTPDHPAEPRDRTARLSSSGGAESAPATEATRDDTDMWFVTGSRVNLRQGPSTSDSVVGQVFEGELAEVLEETSDGWFRIRTPGGEQSGYIFGKFLSPERPG